MITKNAECLEKGDTWVTGEGVITVAGVSVAEDVTVVDEKMSFHRLPLGTEVQVEDRAAYWSSAMPLYADGSTGDVCAEGSGTTIAVCMDRLAREVIRWWPPEDHADGDDVPVGLDLTLSWEVVDA